MNGDKPDIEPDIDVDKTQIKDDRETVSAMEPMLVRESARHREKLADLALELTGLSVGLRRSLPEGIVDALSTLVRAMNCYYSNLIEGHDTHPVDIERALNDDFSQDPEKRDLQKEARAHIGVQQWIDEGGLAGRATSLSGVLETHERFCSLMPEELLWVENPDTGERIKVIPGALRETYVKVGRHVAISPGAIPRFMARFEDAYAKLGTVDSIIAAAAAHHRLLWMHPFSDGNGRVARLMSYALIRDALNTSGLWSIARGLARNEAKYKSHLAACDQPRHGDLDGRGNLSEEALAEFAIFFLETCIDQVRFMESLIEPNRLENRIIIWAQEEMRAGELPAKSDIILKAVLNRGELPRSDAPAILGSTSRHARRVTSALIEHGVLISKSTRAPVRLAFPAALAGRWMPGLFPDKAGSI
jgi:Fic family protein